jgi:hypothetical protein
LDKLIQIKATTEQARKLKLRLAGGDKKLKTTVAEKQAGRSLKDFES